MEAVLEKKIQKFGNSMCVVLPKEWLVSLGLTVGDSVSMRFTGDTIEIEPVARIDQLHARSLSELFRGYSSAYRGEEADWGAPVGDEE